MLSLVLWSFRVNNSRFGYMSTCSVMHAQATQSACFPCSSLVVLFQKLVLLLQHVSGSIMTVKICAASNPKLNPSNVKACARWQCRFNNIAYSIVSLKGAPLAAPAGDRRHKLARVVVCQAGHAETGNTYRPSGKARLWLCFCIPSICLAAEGPNRPGF